MARSRRGSGSPTKSRRIWACEFRPHLGDPTVGQVSDLTPDQVRDLTSLMTEAICWSGRKCDLSPSAPTNQALRGDINPSPVVVRWPNAKRPNLPINPSSHSATHRQLHRRGRV